MANFAARRLRAGPCEAAAKSPEAAPTGFSPPVPRPSQRLLIVSARALSQESPVGLRTRSSEPTLNRPVAPVASSVATSNCDRSANWWKRIGAGVRTTTEQNSQMTHGGSCRMDGNDTQRYLSIHGPRISKSPLTLRQQAVSSCQQ